MKKMQQLLIITLCFSFIFTSVKIPSTLGNVPKGHHTTGVERI